MILNSRQFPEVLRKDELSGASALSGVNDPGIGQVEIPHCSGPLTELSPIRYAVTDSLGKTMQFGQLKRR
jgi:hypothetical protein